MIQTNQDTNKDVEDEGDNFIINPAGLNEVLNQADDDEQFNVKQAHHHFDNRKNTVFTTESTQNDNFDTNHGFLRSHQSIHSHITKKVITHADLFQRQSSIDSPASLSSPSYNHSTSHDDESNTLFNPKRSRNVQLRANAMNRLMRRNIDSIDSIDQEDSPSIISSVNPSLRGLRPNIQSRKSQGKEGLLRQMTDKTDGTLDFSRRDGESEIADRELLETIEKAHFSDFNFKSLEITPRSATGSMTSLNRKERIIDFGMQSNIEKHDSYANSINMEYLSKQKASEKPAEKAPKKNIKVQTDKEANDKPKLNVVEQGFVLEIHSGTLNNNLESPNFKKRRVESQTNDLPEKKHKKKKSKSKSKSKKSPAEGTDEPTEGKKKKKKSKEEGEKTKNKSPAEVPANFSDIEIQPMTKKKDGVLVIDIEADENSKELQRQQTPETEVTADPHKNHVLNEDMMLGLNVVSYFKHRLIPLRNKIYYAIVIALFLASFGTNLMEIILLGTSTCNEIDSHNKFFVYANIVIIFFVKIGIFNFVTFEVSGNSPLDIKYPFLIPVLAFGIFPIMQMPQFIYNWRECQYHNDIFTLDFAFVIVNVFGIAILSLFALFIGLAFFCAGCKIPNNTVKILRNIGYFVALCVFIGINVINFVMQFTQFTSFVTGYFLEILPFWFFFLSGLVLYILRKFKGFQMFKTIQELEVEEKESNPLQKFGAKRGELLPIVNQDVLSNHPETLGPEDKENGATGLSNRNKANITFGEKSVR